MASLVERLNRHKEMIKSEQVLKVERQPLRAFKLQQQKSETEDSKSKSKEEKFDKSSSPEQKAKKEFSQRSKIVENKLKNLSSIVERNDQFLKELRGCIQSLDAELAKEQYADFSQLAENEQKLLDLADKSEDTPENSKDISEANQAKETEKEKYSRRKREDGKCKSIFECDSVAQKLEKYSKILESYRNGFILMNGSEEGDEKSDEVEDDKSDDFGDNKSDDETDEISGEESFDEADVKSDELEAGKSNERGDEKSDED